MSGFDPNAAALPDSGIFGMPYSEQDSKLLLLPIPWQTTSSYGSGQMSAPQAILEASRYIDLFDKELDNFYEVGICFLKENEEIVNLNSEAEKSSLPVIEAAGRIDDSDELHKKAKEVDQLSESMNDIVYSSSRRILDQNKFVGIVGGNHSCPYGNIKAHIEKYPKLSLLQLDAHCDLIKSFEGFKYSHASIMRNIIEDCDLNSLVQVGVRGYCQEEFDYISSNKNRIHCYFESDISKQLFTGTTWDTIVKEIINSLNDEVYISLDIDVFDASLCPNTGTPVPGGLNFQQVRYLLLEILKSGKRIVGFDLVEVVPGDDDWDANVASQILFILCGCLVNSNNNK